MDLYMSTRYASAVISIAVAMSGAYLTFLLTKSKRVALINLVLLSLNWKLIVHGHYANADIFLTLFTTLSLIFAYDYLVNKKDDRRVIFLSVALGLAVGTKITAGMMLPLFVILFIYRKDVMGFLGFIFTVLATFMITNPFSIALNFEFINRIREMATKEAGMVFDSVDPNPMKYMLASIFMLTPFVAAFAAKGVTETIAFLRNKQDRNTNGSIFHILLLSLVIEYLLFFSLQQRRVDRWLLPILPILFLYASLGVASISKIKSKVLKLLLGVICILGISYYYIYFNFLLLQQFQRYTPKAQAYLWLQSNTSPLETKLAYTEEGLDPINKLPNGKAIQFAVYESKGAAETIPQNPYLYNYIIISSRSMENFKREAVRNKYPIYSNRWIQFEDTLNNSGDFELIKSFVLPKPNLIPLSDVYIYRNNNLKVPGNLGLLGT
jgi:hypothetical protein